MRRNFLLTIYPFSRIRSRILSKSRSRERHRYLIPNQVFITSCRWCWADCTQKLTTWFIWITYRSKVSYKANLPVFAPVRRCCCSHFSLSSTPKQLGSNRLTQSDASTSAKAALVTACHQYPYKLDLSPPCQRIDIPIS